MSIECFVDHLNDHLRAIILQELHVQRVDPMSKRQGGGFRMPFGGGGMQGKKEVITYRITGVERETIFLPMYFAVSVLEQQRPPRTLFPSHQLTFAGVLRPSQLEVRKEAIAHLNERGCTLLALHVGFGKSVLAIELACKIRLRTMIIVHRVVLIDQWKEYVQKYCQGWEGRTKVYEDYSGSGQQEDDEANGCDVLIVNALNVPKLSDSFLRTFGFVIVDECHLISTEHFSRSLQHLTPRYMIGLSATPYRNDGMDKIMDLYFGKERLERALRIPHTVYKILTSFEPPMYQTRTGQLDWNRVMEAQSSHDARNDMIVSLTQLYPERRILILCKRREQGTRLIHKLKMKDEHVTRLMGNDRTFDKDARILVATINKAGVGFSHDVLDTLILAADVEEYYIQYLGRITRRPDVEPLIFDIVDKNPTLARHFATRRKVYKEIGGTIVDFRRAFPDFEVI